jgi:phosphatidate cytidylyltransferase
MKSRIITATILIAVVVWIIFFASPLIFDIFVALFLAAGSWEWAGLVPGVNKNVSYSVLKDVTILDERSVEGRTPVPERQNRTHFYSPLQKILFVLLVELLWVAFSLWPIGFQGLLYFNAVLLILLIPALFTYPQTVSCWYSSLTTIILGISFLVTSSVSLEYLKQMPQGELWIITVLLLTWMMDTGAYFCGRFLGRRKLIPLVSPNKTWEGFWGGFLISEFVMIGFGFEFAANVLGWTSWVIAGTLAILGAVIGDLFISMLKRCAQVKDTGSLLPGHGGVLDRVDSLLVSSTIVVLFLVGR